MQKEDSVLGESFDHALNQDFQSPRWGSGLNFLPQKALDSVNENKNNDSQPLENENDFIIASVVSNRSLIHSVE